MKQAAPRDRDQPGGNIVLLLSLNLILLAFFIMLNAMSEFEATRTQAALDSVKRAFHGKIQPKTPTEALRANVAALPEAKDLMLEVGSLFEAVIPSTRNTRTQRADFVRIDLPAKALFRRGRDRLRKGREKLVTGLTAAITRQRRGPQNYLLEISHGVLAPAAAGRRNSAARLGPKSLEVRRTVELVHLFMEAGLPPDMLAISIVPGRPDTVRFVISVREAAPEPGTGTQPRKRAE